MGIRHDKRLIPVDPGDKMRLGREFGAWVLVRVEVRPPHLIIYDRPREEPAVRAFLAERGLLGGPTRH